MAGRALAPGHFSSCSYTIPLKVDTYGLDCARRRPVHGLEQELALALGMTVADLREFRTNPKRANDDVMVRLAQVLIERGDAMKRVGDLLLDDGPRP
jgi:hypothetical protein